MSPKSPKLLPWLAKKAGISERRAEALWRDACRHAAHRAEAGSSTYHKAAIDRLMELVTAESLREDAASFGWRPWARAQHQLWGTTVRLAEVGGMLASRNLRANLQAFSAARPQC